MPVEVDFELMLVEAASKGLSGCLEVRSGDQGTGTVILSAGQVAWAICAKQTENLGCFLERLGHVSHDQLRAVSVKYARKKGAVKLGHLLEESGIISRAVLRRCLLLHVRMAVACLLRGSERTALWTAGSFCADDELTFHLYQVHPDWYSVPAELSAGATWDGLETGALGLASLADLVGYHGSVLADWTGATVATHGWLGDPEDAAGRLAATAVALFEAAPQPAEGGALGDLTQTVLEGSRGSVAARWLDRDHQLFVAVFLGDRGKAGAALHRLASLAATFAEAAANGQQGES